MGFAENMANLGEQFITCFDNRIKDVGRIMNETHNLQRRFNKEQSEVRKVVNEMANRTHEFLDRFRHEFLIESKGQRKQRQNFCKHIQESNHDRANDTHRHMRELRKEYDQGHRAFQRATNEIKRHRDAATFPSQSKHFERSQEFKRPPRKGRRHKKGN